MTSSQSTGEKALAAEYSVAEFVAYLHRVGYHEIAERVSDDRQIIVLDPEVFPLARWLPRGEDER